MSVAGRDKGRLYLIVRQEGDRLYLADGEYRKADGAKPKNRKHVELLPVFDRAMAERIAAGKEEDSNIRALLRRVARERRG